MGLVPPVPGALQEARAAHEHGIVHTRITIPVQAALPLHVAGSGAVRAVETGWGSGVYPVLLLRVLRQWRFA